MECTLEGDMNRKFLAAGLILAGASTPVLSLAFAASDFPKTAACPIDGGTAHATGKTRKATQTACTDVEYKHKGTDYSDPRHPQKFNHLFWVTHCAE
jgi:hypothetical protein